MSVESVVTTEKQGFGGNFPYSEWEPLLNQQPLYDFYGIY